MRKLLLLVPLVLCACGPREAGPLEGERGDVMYWLVTGSTFTQENCTDSPEWKDNVKAPTFEPNSYVLYSVNADGKSAVSQDCETTLASSCKPDPSITFDVAGHTLTHVPAVEKQAVENSTCEITLSQVWTLTDQGETMPFDLDITLKLTGNTAECELLNESVKAQSPNGKGLDGCQVKLKVQTAFDHAG